MIHKNFTFFGLFLMWNSVTFGNTYYAQAISLFADASPVSADALTKVLSATEVRCLRYDRPNFIITTKYCLVPVSDPLLGNLVGIYEAGANKCPDSANSAAMYLKNQSDGELGLSGPNGSQFMLRMTTLQGQKYWVYLQYYYEWAREICYFKAE